jgi:hypothetical protein
MKKQILNLFALMLAASEIFGQAPNAFNYQAALRNSSGQPLANQLVSLRFTIRDGGTSGSILYQETQNKTTNAQGLVNCAVGSGNVAQGTYPTAAQWGAGNKFIQVEADPSGGSSYLEISNVQILSVPYSGFANAAATAATATTATTATTANTANALSPTATVTPSQITSGGATAGQILKWSGSTWVASNDGPTTILLSQIESGGASSGQYLRWDGTKWAPATVTATVSPSQITQGGANTGQVLKWNGTAWTPAADDNSSLTAGTGITITGGAINSTWTAGSGNIYNNNTGNVGIGTNSPTYPLTVNSSAGNGEIEARTAGSSSYAGLRLTNSSSASTLFTKGASGLTGNTLGMPSAGLAYINNASSGSLLLSTADSVAFGTNSLERMRINKNGDVAIGGVSPHAKFHVKGSGNKYLIPFNTIYDYSAAVFGVPDTITTANIVSTGVLGQGKGSAYFNAGIAGFSDNSGTFNVGALFEARAGAITGKRNYGIYSDVVSGYSFVVGHYNSVTATTNSANGNYGTYADVSGTAGAASYGVYGSARATSTSFTNYGVYGSATGGLTNYGGYFSGNVYVSGTLSKAGGTFQIDHPQDPENKYLIHSFVESPDMMNIYNGNITTDANGEATVTMPSYFNALNVDFRYQLTVLGPDFAQAIVAKKMEDNNFKIKTDKPNIEVSWQVTGVRNDAWAKANRVEPEKMKEANAKGKYLHPELFGKPANQGIHYVNTEGIAAPSTKIRR